MHLTSGRWAAAYGEVVIDKNAADKYGFSVGDTTKVAVDAGVFPVKIVGVAHYGDVDSLGGATFAVFDIPTAQKLFSSATASLPISVAAKPGVDAAALVSELRRSRRRPRRCAPVRIRPRRTRRTSPAS